MGAIQVKGEQLSLDNRPLEEDEPLEVELQGGTWLPGQLLLRHDGDKLVDLLDRPALSVTLAGGGKTILFLDSRANANVRRAA